MNNISISNTQQLAFGSAKTKKILQNAGEKLNLRDKLRIAEYKMSTPMSIPVIQAKNFKELGLRLKMNYCVNKISSFFNPYNILNLFIKEKPSNTKTLTDLGYEFVMKNKDNLKELSRESYAKNPDYLKGMLKALKELGLVK